MKLLLTCQHFLFLLFLITTFVAEPSTAARFLTDDSSSVPRQIIVSDSLKVGKTKVENPIATVSVLSSLAAVVLTTVAFSGDQLSFDAMPFALMLGIVGVLSALLGFVKRRKLIHNKYKDDPNRRKLPLGQARSVAGLLLIPVGFIILLSSVNSCS